MRRLAVIFVVILSSPAFAQSPEDMIARGHYEMGAEAYDEARYEDALREFEMAHAAEAIPALDYNIARCLERLGRRQEAATAYERYLGAAPSAENAAELRARVVELRKSPDIVQIVHGDPPLPRRRYVAPGALAGGALALGIVGAGLLGAAAHDYGALRSSCSPTCLISSWAPLPAREHAGEAMLGLAGAALVVDVVLWVRAARRGR